MSDEGGVAHQRRVVKCHEKKRYKDKILADIALSKILTRSNRPLAGKFEKSVYRCKICRGFHLTSQVKKVKVA